MKKFLITLFLFMSVSLFADTVITGKNSEESISKFLLSGTYVEIHNNDKTTFILKNSITKIIIDKDTFEIRSNIDSEFYDFWEDLKVILDSKNNIIISIE